jgi:hydrogenase expression/formation protein HypE
MTSSFALDCPVPEFSWDTIELGHGGGGLMTKRLIDGIFRPAFGAGPADLVHDGALIDPGAGQLAFTTDSFVVRPLFFPGGDIGALAVNGTVNDLAMCGAEPLAMSVGFILEEGLPVADLARVAASMRAAADAAGVRLVTGDTKVVERGHGDGLYVNTSGIGRVIAPEPITPDRVAPGDVILVSGDLGRHGIAIMAVREGLGFETEILSDCAPLISEVKALIDAGVNLRCLRDLTRGGLATALAEIAGTAGVLMRLQDAAIPVPDVVRGACEILGLDPLYVANEGRFAAFVPAAEADGALAVLRRFNPTAAIIGRVEGRIERGEAVLDTIGGERPLDLMSGEQLPRIC